MCVCQNNLMMGTQRSWGPLSSLFTIPRCLFVPFVFVCICTPLPLPCAHKHTLLLVIYIYIYIYLIHYSIIIIIFLFLFSPSLLIASLPCNFKSNQLMNCIYIKVYMISFSFGCVYVLSTNIKTQQQKLNKPNIAFSFSFFFVGEVLNMINVDVHDERAVSAGCPVIMFSLYL